jgi:hypothetical protein
MNRKHLAGATALALLFLTGAAFAGDEAPAAPDWMTTVAGQKLSAVDGSSIQFNVADKGVLLAVTSPGGETQKNIFAMMSDRLGTVSDGANGDHLIGFFRTTDSGLEAQFADGHNETLSMNSGGGVSVTLTSAANGKACMAWYPQGHVFSEAERKLAVAEYAQRLGVTDGKIPAVSHSCDAPAQSPKVASASSHPASTAHHAAHAQMAANDKGLVPIMVRTSIVHAVDGAVSAPVVAAATVTPKVAAAVATPKPAPVVSMGPMVQQASARSSDEGAAQEAAVEPGHGASGCLSVDNDGADLGFRNQCGFSVEFTYCLENAGDPAITCDEGSRAGNVAANSFAPLLRGVNIKAEDAEHDVRWVGCTGAQGEVVAHLDKTDPPAGRCVRTQAS